MATAGDIIQGALKRIHVLDADEAPSASETADGLTVLNELLDSWNIDRGYIYSLQEDIFNWTAAAESMTVGPTGDVVITRPVRLHESSFYVDPNGNDYLLDILVSRSSYSRIVDKETSSDLPQHIFYEPEFPDGKIFIWPVPDEALSIHLHSWKAAAEFAAATDTFSFPPGYRLALTGTLAEELSGIFGVAVPPEVAKSAVSARRRVQKLNRRRRILAEIETGALLTGRGFNVFTGD